MVSYTAQALVACRLMASLQQPCRGDRRFKVQLSGQVDSEPARCHDGKHLLSHLMKISRTHRYLAAVIVVISLLFTQLALASYACPGLAPATQTVAAIASADMAAMPDCKGMDAGQPNLCHAFGHAVHQSLDKPDLPQVPPLLAIGPALFVLMPAPDVFQPLPRREVVSLLHNTSPPLAIQHCCFRI
jgi:hypothetical protein